MNKIALTFLLTISTHTFSNEIVLSSKIDKDLAPKILKDLQVLNSFEFNHPVDLTTSEIFGVKELTGTALNKWINDRVKYIVEEDYTSLTKMLTLKTLSVEEKNVLYPNPNVLPFSLDESAFRNERTMTIMSNVGSAVYLTGKFEKKLYGMKISQDPSKQQIKLLVKSPRVGVIQVGEGLFHPMASANPNDINSYANTLNRIATFAHEARHSDGNGGATGFGHSKCPAGHTMEGSYSCEESLNGPYSVGAALLLEFVKQCKDKCSLRETSSLIMIAFDNQARVLKADKRGAPLKVWDTTPESL